MEVAVEPCTQYNYVITASRESPYAEDAREGTFTTDCSVPSNTTSTKEKGRYLDDLHKESQESQKLADLYNKYGRARKIFY